MKHMVEVEIPAQPARTETRESHIACDLCGAKGQSTYTGGVTNWTDDRFDYDRTGIVHDQGYSYSDDRGGKRRFVDICVECFEKKLVPWLAEQGATVREEDY